MSLQNLASEIEEFITFKNANHQTVRATLISITKDSLVFEAYDPYCIMKVSEVISDLSLIRSEKSTKIGKAVVKNIINTGLTLIISADIANKWSYDQDSQIVNDNIDPLKSANEFFAKWQSTNQELDIKFKLITLKIKSFLSDSRRWLDKLDISHKINDSDKLLEKIEQPFINYLAEMLLEFEEVARNIDESMVATHRRFLQKELHPLTLQAPFVNRAYSKPLGYAGDYEIVNMMLRSPFEGNFAYSKMVNKFFLNTTPALAHRNRIDILVKEIEKTALNAIKNNKKAKIFSVACGPAIEIQRFIATNQLAKNCEFTLLDFNEETLEYLAKKIEEAKIKGNNQEVITKIIHKSVFDLLKDASNSKKSDQDFDLIYCAGLFDYLSDRVCTKLLELFFLKSKKNGRVIATNVHSRNPARFMAEYLMEWYLVHRNENDLTAISPVKNCNKFYCDSTGCNIFLEFPKIL